MCAADLLHRAQRSVHPRAVNTVLLIDVPRCAVRVCRLRIGAGFPARLGSGRCPCPTVSAGSRSVVAESCRPVPWSVWWRLRVRGLAGAAPLMSAALLFAEPTPDTRILAARICPLKTRVSDRAGGADTLGSCDLQPCGAGVTKREKDLWILAPTRCVMAPIECRRRLFGAVHPRFTHHVDPRQQRGTHAPSQERSGVRVRPGHGHEGRNWRRQECAGRHTPQQAPPGRRRRQRLRR